MGMRGTVFLWGPHPGVMGNRKQPREGIRESRKQQQHFTLAYYGKGQGDESGYLAEERG